MAPRCMGLFAAVAVSAVAWVYRRPVRLELLLVPGPVVWRRCGSAEYPWPITPGIWSYRVRARRSGLASHPGP